jgi:tetratricopeptide (TPR) repeat protein
MSRRVLRSCGLGLLGLLAMIASSGRAVRGDEDPRTSLQFIHELRDRGLHDLALDYITALRTDAGQPASVKDVLDYEEGRTLIDEAAKSGDLVLRQEFLKDAKKKLDSFVAAHPTLQQARDALVQMGKLLIQSGHDALLLSEETHDQAKKDSKVAEARAAFVEARGAYDKAIEPLNQAYKKFSGFIPEGDPRRADRDAIYATLLDAMLQKAVAEYELGETYAAGSPDRAKLLKAALEQFESLYKSYREQWAGLAARMWQAKCYEEQGEIGSAVAIYKELLSHTDPRLRDLQRHVYYFYIVALAKRKQYALAADEATQWISRYNRRDDLRSAPGQGVLVELAKNIDAQMPEISDAEKPRAVRKIVDSVQQVVKYTSPYKKDALALLKKYKPSAAVKAEEIVRLSYEDAVGQADEAIAAHEWEKAITLLKAAVRKADPARSIDKANMARYNLAFCYYMNKQYYEADVLAEHLARRYPQGGLSAKATEIGMQALFDAYNAITEIDKGSEIPHVIDLATYTATTWPNNEQGDAARFNLGLIYTGMGQYDKAIETFNSVRHQSPKWVEAQNRLGAAYWAKSRQLERKGDAAGAQAAGQKAIDELQGSLKARRDASANATDPGLVGNVGDLALVLTETGKPAVALNLLAPVVSAQTVKTGAAYTRLMEAQLTAYITSGNVDAAVASMKALEEAGGAAGRAQLYFKLAKLLEKELDALKQQGKAAALAQMHKVYKAFLTTLADSKTGQTYESLDFAALGLLNLDAYTEAEKVLRRALDQFTQDPQFVQRPNGRTRLLLTRLKLAWALRGQQKFDEASSLLDELMGQKPPFIEVLFERAMLTEAEADAHKGSYATALSQWEDVAKRLERAPRPRPAHYYDAWYHVALVLSKLKDPAKARQTLQGIMRLAPSVGSPEMKAKYEGLLERLKRSKR